MTPPIYRQHQRIKNLETEEIVTSEALPGVPNEIALS